MINIKTGEKMSKKVTFFTILFLLVFSTISYAHSGRTDSSGGHNCSPKSQAKGLCSGYHYHNGGSTSSGSSSSSVSRPAVRNDKDCSDFATYDEVVAYWNAKGYSATYDPENLDGWGNGQVDDGIPCEAPSGYDKTKINHSPEQKQFKQDQADTANGENQGYQQGLKDGYAEASASDSTSNGSEAFQTGYSTGYSKGYDEGKRKIDTEKTLATNAGYALGQKQDVLSIPDAYSKHPGLKESFESGFNKAIDERIEEYRNLGYVDGKKDSHTPPKDINEMFVHAYQEGYDEAQELLEKEYREKGYAAAFTMLEMKEPELSNEKFKKWYIEGFQSNKEIEDIQEAAYSLGEKGEEYSIPSKFKKGEVIFKHYYEQGYQQYEEQQKQNKAAAAGGIGIAALSWFGRRLYVAKKMIS